MANGIKYTTGSVESGCLKKGSMLIALNTTSYGTTFYSGITPPGSGYTIYQNKASDGPSIYCPTNDTDLVFFTNYQVAGSAGASAGYVSAEECLGYYAGETDKICVNIDYEGIVTDGLLCAFDAGFTASYPKAGATGYDLSGGSLNLSLTNVGYTEINKYGLSMFSFLQANNNYSTVDSGSGILSNTAYTKVVWFRFSGSYPVNPLVGAQNTIDDHLFSIAVAALTNPPTIYTLRAGNAGSTDTVTTPGAVMELNVWYCGAVTFDTLNGWNLYLNGTSIATSSDTTTFANPAGVQIGSSVNKSDLDGDIAIVQIYNRVLSATEITQNWNAQKVRFGY